MILACLLVIFLVLLLAYSMSGEDGKNTKFARRGANAIAQEQKTGQPIDTSKGIETN
jgi:hypothetical protein